MAQLSEKVNTFGRLMRRRYGERVHKLALNAAFTCPNRDGSKGRGGCTFCNNVTFSPHARVPDPIARQIDAGRRVIRRRTGARRYLAYFQAYTNTYADVASLRALYDQALAEPDVIGLSVGTRPDCVSSAVLDLLCSYRDAGYEVWLELGLQSAFDETLQRVNRGHGWREYLETVTAARHRGLQVCTHLIAGLPGEGRAETLESHRRVLVAGTDGLKLHPLHVVKGTALANSWRRGEYQPMSRREYIETAVDVVQASPPEIVFHRLTGTADEGMLLAPGWCSEKWRVLNGIDRALAERRGLVPETGETKTDGTRMSGR